MSRERDFSLMTEVRGLRELQQELRRANPETARRLQQVNKRLVDDVASDARSKFYRSVAQVSAIRLGPVRMRPSGRGSIGRSRDSIRASASGREARVIAGGARAPAFFGHEFGGSRGLGGGRQTTSAVGRAAAQGNRHSRRLVRTRTRQFPEHRGRDGYVLYPLVRKRIRTAAEDWNNLFDEVFQTREG
jgi:hypothetical protein